MFLLLKYIRILQIDETCIPVVYKRNEYYLRAACIRSYVKTFCLRTVNANNAEKSYREGNFYTYVKVCDTQKKAMLFVYMLILYSFDIPTIIADQMMESYAGKAIQVI